MPATISPITRVLIAAVVAAALSAGSLGAAAPAGATAPATGATVLPPAERHLTCAKLQKRLNHEQRLEARHANKLARLAGLEAKAQSAGHTARIVFFQKAISREKKIQFRFLHSRAVAGLAGMAPLITGKCHEAAPIAAPAAS